MLSEKMKEGRDIKVIIFISTLIITSLLYIIAATPPAAGYEISIYRVFPWYFWLLVIISFIWGLSVSFKELFDVKNIDKTKISIPILTMAVTTSILLLMPLIRGYATYGRGDVMGHIGAIKDILHTGNFGDNWYPILHILGASLSETVNLNPKIIPMIFPPIFLLIYLFGVFYLGRELFGKKISIVVLILSLIPILGRTFIFFAPSQFSFVFLPYFLYILFRGMKEPRYFYLCLLTVFPFIISHPHRSLFFIVILLVILLSISIFKLSDLRKRYELKYGSNLTLLSLLIWIVWYLMYYKAERTVKTLRAFVFARITGAQEEYAGIATEYSPPLIYYVKVGLNQFGIVGILSLLSLIFIFILFSPNYLNKLIKHPSNQINTKKYVKNYRSQTTVLISLFMFFLILASAFFVTGAPGGHGRLLVYVILFSTFLVAILYFVSTKEDISILKKYKLKELTYIFLIILIIISVFNLYHAPWQVTQNSQATEMEFSGTEWTFENRNDSLLMKDIVGTPLHRFHYVIYGRRAEIENFHRYGSQVNPHLGYVENDTLGAQYENDVYFILSEYSRIRHRELYPDWEEAQLYTEDDFEKLESDRTANKIYDCGEFDTYYISST